MSPEKVDKLPDRVKEWDDFAKEVHDYILKFTVPKYSSKNKFDLISITEPRVCVWNILKYALRLWNGRGKQYDWFKIAHYCQMGWTEGNRSGSTDWKALGIEEDQTKTG